MPRIIPGVTKRALTHNLKLYRTACASVNKQVSKDAAKQSKGITSNTFDKMLDYGTGQFIEDMNKAFNINDNTYFPFLFSLRFIVLQLSSLFYLYKRYDLC